MVATSETAQSLASTPKKERKRRSQAEKVGRLKYIIELEHRILKELKILRTTQRYMIKGLDIGGYLQFDGPYIEKVCCRDAVDLAVLDELLQVGDGGILPSHLAAKLSRYKLDRWQVVRRIQRMNKALDKEIAQKVAEKRGHKWALTDFAYRAWKQTEKELENEGGDMSWTRK